jgi:hypothetical protein
VASGGNALLLHCLPVAASRGRGRIHVRNSSLSSLCAMRTLPQGIAASFSACGRRCWDWCAPLPSRRRTSMLSTLMADSSGTKSMRRSRSSSCESGTAWVAGLGRCGSGPRPPCWAGEVLVGRHRRRRRGPTRGLTRQRLAPAAAGGCMPLPPPLSLLLLLLLLQLLPWSYQNVAAIARCGTRAATQAERVRAGRLLLPPGAPATAAAGASASAAAASTARAASDAAARCGTTWVSRTRFPTKGGLRHPRPSLRTCSFREMPRTGPRWMRFIRCCAQPAAREVRRVSNGCAAASGRRPQRRRRLRVGAPRGPLQPARRTALPAAPCPRTVVKPAILLRRRLLWMMAISSQTRLLVSKSRVRRL